MTTIDHRGERRERGVGASDVDGAYDDLRQWSDRRLEETYHRLSHDLRRRGFEVRTVHRMGRLEEEVRRRGTDVDRIAREVDAAHGDRGS